VWLSSQFSVLCDCVTVGNYSLYTLKCKSHGVSYEAASYVLWFPAVLIMWDAESALGWWVFGVTALKGGGGVLWLVRFRQGFEALLKPCLVIANSELNTTEDSSIGILYAVCQSHDTGTTYNTTKTKHTQNEEKITRTHQQ